MRDKRRQAFETVSSCATPDANRSSTVAAEQMMFVRDKRVNLTRHNPNNNNNNNNKTENKLLK